MVRITRRDFLKYCAIGAGALGLSTSTLMKLEDAYAKETANGGIPVIWIDGAACTGCSMTLLNSVFYTTVEDLLVNTLDLNFHKTVMTAAGSPNATGANALTAVHNAYSGADNVTGVPLYVLVVEGGIQCALAPGTLELGGYCKNGELTTVAGQETMLANTQLLASHALAVLSVGTCASFGGIPGAKGGPTDSRGTIYAGTSATRGALVDPKVAYSTSPTAFSNAVGSYGFSSSSPITNILGMPIKDVTINISGCPPHPDWIVGTVAHIISNLPPIATLAGLVLAGDIPALQSTLAAALPPVTSYKRPMDYGYREYQCNAGPCTWRYNNITRRAKNTDSYDPNAWQPPILITGTSPWPAWTTQGGPAGTSPAPSITYYTSEPDYNPRYQTGDSKALGRNKWTGNDVGCLGILGCKGRKTKADCSRRRWNTATAEEYGVNWCVGSRGNCHGCTEPTFPDKVGKFYTFV
jgi:Ni,Fe-hydrogenase I small subunit